MEFNNKKVSLIAGIILCSLVVETFGHSYVTSPQSRSNQKQTQSGCRGSFCLGPCDVPLSSMRGTSGTYKRGDQITVQWPRNNHAGGFIRFAWAITSQSDSHSAFDTHVSQINCHEVGGCGPSNPSDPNGGDNGAGDGSFKPCQSTITVPGDLSDGSWTLQWAWFGGAFALGDYYSCVDIIVSGGPVSSLTPVFVGGDYSNPNTQKCKFFNTNQLHMCVNEPCNNPIFPASQQQIGVPAFLQKNSDGSIVPVTIGSGSSTPTPVTPAATSTSTSAKASTSTSAKSSTSTSAKSSTSTSAKSSTSTSAAVPASGSSSSSSASSASGSSSSCQAGQMKCLTSETFAMCVYNAWGPAMGCAPGTTCQSMGDQIQCGWPIN